MIRWLRATLKKLHPHSLLRRAAPAISRAGGCVREEVGPGGFGVPGAEERRPQQGRTTNELVGARTKRGGAQGWWSAEWPEGCVQWQCDCTAVAARLCKVFSTLGVLTVLLKSGSDLHKGCFLLSLCSVSHLEGVIQNPKVCSCFLPRHLDQCAVGCYLQSDEGGLSAFCSWIPCFPIIIF